MSDHSLLDSILHDCSNTTANIVVGSAVNVAKVVLLIPLYSFILSLGLQQWRQQRSLKTVNHSDIFTYHLAVVELVWLIAFCFYLLGMFTPVSEVVAYHFICMSWYGENYFHVLTCVERYLAVVHPIVYMRLRNAKGVRIRNISIGCVWVLSAVGSGFMAVYFNPLLPIPFIVPFAICVVAVSFCSLSVLYVLIRPGPGDEGQGREVVNQAKRRAFCTIMSILVVLWLWFGSILMSFVLYITIPGSFRTKCVLVSYAYMFNLPSASVLPLLYLHRAGKLSHCSNKKG